MASLNTKLATTPNVSANYVLKATTSTTIGNSLIFDNGTNVGIGTASPFAIADTNLTVNGTTSSAIQLGFNGTRYGQFYTDSGEIRLSAVANLPLTFYSNNLERMRITSGGGVMIGTSSDTGRRLYVLGSTSNSSAWNSTFDNSSGGTIIGFRNDGLISTGGTLSYSPYNLTITSTRALFVDSSGTLGYVASVRESKTNIKYLENIDWINQLKPISFNYRKKDDNNNYIEDYSEEMFYGLIADEVEAVNPDFVFYDIKEDGTKKLAGVKYECMTAVLIKAIQELNAKVSALENKA